MNEYDLSQPLIITYCFAAVLLAGYAIHFCVLFGSSWAKMFWIIVSLIVGIPALYCLIKFALFYYENGSINF